MPRELIIVQTTVIALEVERSRWICCYPGIKSTLFGDRMDGKSKEQRRTEGDP